VLVGDHRDGIRLRIGLRWSLSRNAARNSSHRRAGRILGAIPAPEVDPARVTARKARFPPRLRRPRQELERALARVPIPGHAMAAHHGGHPPGPHLAPMRGPCGLFVEELAQGRKPGPDSTRSQLTRP